MQCDGVVHRRNVVDRKAVGVSFADGRQETGFDVFESVNGQFAICALDSYANTCVR